MYAINRIGQKVVCIVPRKAWTSLCQSMKCTPEKGKVYTVAGFAEISNLPGIHLKEIAGFSCECAHMKNEPWLITAFRPLDERKTDISVFKKLLTRKTKKKELIDD